MSSNSQTRSVISFRVGSNSLQSQSEKVYLNNNTPMKRTANFAKVIRLNDGFDDMSKKSMKESRVSSKNNDHCNNSI